MSTAAPQRATLDDLARAEGKAELIAGRVVPLSPSGFEPGRVALEIAVSLRAHARATGRGFACADGNGFAVPALPSGRESFCPDAAYYDGPPPARRMRFVLGPPTFAVEVRSEGDYGPAAERALAAKRADYFAAGTLVVWDVDTVGQCVHAYRATDPNEPAVFERGDVADAEPAVPGWRLDLGELFALA